MSKYQFIVIVASTERKQIIESQFKQLDIDMSKNTQIHYLEASVVANSQDYLYPTERFTSNQLKVMCCTRSHLRAIDYALREDSPDFSIIMEDDVAMHKTKFISAINEIIDKWREICSPLRARMVSIGWVPCNSYSYYLNPPQTMQPSNAICLPSLQDALILHNYGPGMQCYIVSKSDIPTAVIQLTSHANTTFDNFAKQFRLFLNAHANNYSIKYFNENDYDCYAIDEWLNKMLGAVRMHPMVAIEQDVPSLLNHNNQNGHWKRYFDNFEHIKKDYMTF